MARLVMDVFLASRFEEFKEIRNKLSKKMSNYKSIEAIDLNNNLASHRSPLAESLFYVKKAEVMILLVGETYGTIPDGETLSYTHLEYKEAIKESSNTVVLVFCIGKSYSGKYINYSNEDDNMKNWQVELEKNHRLSKFSGQEPIDTIIDKIMNTVLISIYDRNPSEDLDFEQDEELYIDIAEDENTNFLEDEEITLLDNKKIDNADIEITEIDEENLEGFDLLRIPSKLASLEQKKEAQQAIAIRDYYTARKHLRKSIEYRPLDFESNYWLAKLYVKSEKKSLFYDIEEHLLRAAKIAEQENNLFKASHCYQLIIQAAIFSDKEQEGHKYIKLAEELTPNFARLYYEKAKFLLYFNHFKNAKSSLMQAINIRIDILKDISIDPFFKQYKEIIAEVKRDMKDHLQKSCYAISSQTNTIKEILNEPTNIIDIHQLSIYGLWKESRHSFITQYKLLSNAIYQMIDNNKEAIDNKIKLLIEEKHIEIEKLKKEEALKIKQLTNKYNDNNQISNKNHKLVYILKTLLKVLNSKKSKMMFEKEVNSIKSDFIAKISQIEQQYKDIEVELKNKLPVINKKEMSFSKAFEIFENITVSKSTPKLVPFKSLNNASYGSIIRITPQSYVKYINNDNKIEILEDFPQYAHVKAIDTSKYSFLGKVIRKEKNQITISRYHAYCKV
jgi:hypothetical protein